jgi:polyketide biosynthesis acyl carrier protein
MKSPTDLHRDEVARNVHAAIANVLPGLAPGAVTGQKHLRDLGADSIDRVEIILAISDRLGLQEPMASFAPLPDIDSLIDFVLEVLRR